MRSRFRHEMKIHPEYFDAVHRGHMKFQLRRDDREEGFQVGDELLLKEWDPKQYEKVLTGCSQPTESDIIFAEQSAYTGQERLVRVDYIMDKDMVRKIIHPLLEPDEMDEFVIMSVSLLP